MSSRSESYITDNQAKYAESYDRYQRLSFFSQCPTCAETLPLVEDMNCTFLEVSTHLGNRIAAVEEELKQARKEKELDEKEKVSKKRWDDFRISCADITTLVYNQLWTLVRPMYKAHDIKMHKSAFFDDLVDNEDMAIQFRNAALTDMRMSVKDYEDLVACKDLRNKMYHSGIDTIAQAAEYLHDHEPPANSFVHVTNILKNFILNNA